VARLVVLALLHIHYLPNAINSSNMTFDLILPSILKVSQLGWSLVSATIPCLRTFVLNLGTGYLGGTNFDKILAAGASHRAYTSTDCYAMDTLGSSRKTKTSKVTAAPFDSVLNRSLTRASQDENEDFGIRTTTGYEVSFEERLQGNERSTMAVGRE